MDSLGVFDAIAKGIHRFNPSIDIRKFALADGEGSINILAFHLTGDQKNSYQSGKNSLSFDSKIAFVYLMH